MTGFTINAVIMVTSGLLGLLLLWPNTERALDARATATEIRLTVGERRVSQEFCGNPYPQAKISSVGNLSEINSGPSARITNMSWMCQ